MTISKLLSIKDAATMLGLSPWTLRHYLCQGKLPFVKIGRRTLLEPSVLEDLIAQGRRGYPSAFAGNHS
jgi:excisionase family DNA binding protein